MRRRKIRKFADNQASRHSENSSKTEATLILCGYSGERANRGDSTIKEEVRRRKIRKFASRQRTIKQTNKHYMTLPAAPYTIHHTIQKDTNIMFNMDLLTYLRIITRLHLHHIQFPLVPFPLDDLLLPPQVVQFLKILHNDHYINF